MLADNPVLETLSFGLFLFSASSSMLTSTIFHTFNCHSFGTYKWTCRFDYMGISLLMLGSCSPLIYHGFICAPFWQTFYLAAFGILGAIGMAISFIPIFATAEYAKFRAGIIMSLTHPTTTEPPLTFLRVQYVCVCVCVCVYVYVYIISFFCLLRMGCFSSFAPVHIST